MLFRGPALRQSSTKASNGKRGPTSRHRQPLKTLAIRERTVPSPLKSTEHRTRLREESGSNNIVVCVRVRPPNIESEIAPQSETDLTLRISESTVSYTNHLLDNPVPKYFSFDRAYTYSQDWQEDQSYLCETLSSEILENAFAGYNCCCFCYGQTGSGKTYTMFGPPGDPARRGILPRVCSGIFAEVNRDDRKNLQEIEFEVSLSMIEIYNEQLRDLLNPNSRRKLKIRSNGRVKGLETRRVSDLDVLLQTIREADVHRHVAATRMNDRSSRSHTIAQLTFSQTHKYAGRNVRRYVSTINLVDLAGLERTERAGTVGDRQKEGIAINTSLSHLGLCIKTLSENVAKKKKNRREAHVPFRNSKLTFLLQQSLIGNSRTIVIVNVSPRASDAEETRMALQFASRVKVIETVARVNEDMELKRRREEMVAKRVNELENQMIEMQDENVRKLQAVRLQFQKDMDELTVTQQRYFDGMYNDVCAERDTILAKQREAHAAFRQEQEVRDRRLAQEMESRKARLLSLETLVSTVVQRVGLQDPEELQRRLEASESFLRFPLDEEDERDFSS